MDAGLTHDFFGGSVVALDVGLDTVEVRLAEGGRASMIGVVLAKTSPAFVSARSLATIVVEVLGVLVELDLMRAFGLETLQGSLIGTPTTCHSSKCAACASTPAPISTQRAVLYEMLADAPSKATAWWKCSRRCCATRFLPSASRGSVCPRCCSRWSKKLWRAMRTSASSTAKEMHSALSAAVEQLIGMGQRADFEAMARPQPSGDDDDAERTSTFSLGLVTRTRWPSAPRPARTLCRPRSSRSRPCAERARPYFIGSKSPGFQLPSKADFSDRDTRK